MAEFLGEFEVALGVFKQPSSTIITKQQDTNDQKSNEQRAESELPLLDF
jgi:hypothetical protein